ncbi:mid1-interacting protein 1-B [Nerophis lumbriciformis]|uniref:mid1-interacting protein 1-B n=1 Tax=Nerophis lumbriciformis TaxID=546530 RepID=UPI002AE018B3|nr:mid1-interacting protein 1-B-like [Nerophis lumbriciformis]
MMQLTRARKQKHSLLSSMNHFIGAVNNMDQTVMVPSLLMDVPLDEDTAMAHLKSDVDDMYSHYQLLKSLRWDMESGSSSGEQRRKEGLRRAASASSTSSSLLSSSEEDEDDLQKLFQFHLAGLQGVLSKLTLKADSLTRCYRQRVGV